MTKLFQTLIFLTIIQSVLAQDIIFTISAGYHGEKTSLDSIIVDNLSSGLSASFGSLPEHNYYQINLSKNSYWGTVSAFDLKKPSDYVIYENIPGRLSVGYNGLTPVDADISIVDMNGQSIYSRDNLFLYPQNVVQVKLGSEGVYFVRIHSSVENKTFKALGSADKSGDDIEIIEGNIMNSNNTTKLKNTTLVDEGTFPFQEGDSIRIMAFKNGIYAFPKLMKIIKSEDIVFQFDDVHYITEVEQAYPDSAGKLIPFEIDGKNFYCRKVNGDYIFQGDILLTEQQISNEGASLDSYFSLINLWPENRVYYEINGQLQNDERLIKALEYWSLVSPVKFIARSDEDNYVEFMYDEESTCSHIGMIGGRQEIKISKSAEWGSVLHEMCHTVGLIHEHSRSDRNEHVDIHWENINREWNQKSITDADFSRFPISFNTGPFDFESVMMHNPFAGSKVSNSPTISKIDGSTFKAQRSALSVGDIRALEKLYGRMEKPGVKINHVYNSNDSTLDITGRLENRGASDIIEKMISWKKVGDPNYNHEIFYGADSIFKLSLQVHQCGEYLFYASATNSFGSSRSTLNSFTRSGNVLLNVQFISSSAALVEIIVDGQPLCIDKYEILLWEGGLNDENTPGIPLKHTFIENVNEKVEVLLNGLNPGRWYTVVCRKWNNDGSKDDFESFFQTKEANTVTDSRDGITYKTVQIGNQVWMAENLKATTYRNGDSIPNVTEDEVWRVLNTGAYCNYNNEDSLVNTYGRLYNWHAVNDERGLCPDGWHVPGDEEWTALTEFLGGEPVAGGKMKETGTTHWLAPNTGATNESGFQGLPGGYREPGWGMVGNPSSGGRFIEIGKYGHWWSATDLVDYADRRFLLYNDSRIQKWDSYPKSSGFSVRCVKD